MNEPISKNIQVTYNKISLHNFLMNLGILNQYVNHEITDVQAAFRKGEEPEIKLPTSAGSLKKQEISRKTSISALLTMPKQSL